VRLNRVYREMVPGADILATLDPLFVAFTRERFGNESFGDFCLRTALPLAAPDGTAAAAIV
jgi:sulfite reductase beta subunit-like hemoprotein